MKKFLIGLAVVVVLLIAAVVAIPFFVPVETFKQQAIAGVKSATGRDLKIDGAVKFSVFPAVAFEANQVSLSNAAGAATKDMVTLAMLRVKVDLIPLLSKNISIDEFVLIDPVINLETDRQGKGNWVFGPPSAASAPAAGSPAKPAAAGGGMDLSELKLGDVRLVNGRLTFRDGQTSKTETVENINLKLALPGLDKPFKADGDLAWHSKKISLAAGIASPKQLLVDGKPTALNVKVSGEPLNLAFDGTVKLPAPLTVGGTVDLAVPSIRALAAWAGSPLTTPGMAADKTLGALSIKGKVGMNGPTKFSFTDAAIAIDAIKAKGGVEADVTGKPYVKATLDVDMLDLNPYLPPEPPAGAAKPAAPAGAPAGQASAAKDDDWSDAPLDLSALRLANADLGLSVGGIKARKIEVGKSALKVALKDGRMAADLTELNLYKGNGTGRVMLDGSGAGAGVESTFKLANVQVEPLLRDAAGFEKLSGAGALDFAVTGKGRSQRELIGALNGKGAINFADGAIKGINLAAILRNPVSVITGSSQAAEKTDFSSLAGTYTITNGIVKNTDLALLSPLLRVGGNGSVDLPKRTVDYRIEGKLAATTQGQGGGNAAGVTIPVLVKGPWSNLSYQPDMSGLMKSPGAAIDAAKELLKGGQSGGTSGGGGIGGALKGILGR